MKETPAFCMDTIYINAFYAVSSLSMTKLLKKDITDFCYMLEEELIESYGCKFVYLLFDKVEEKKFIESYFGTYAIIGDEIFLTNKEELENLEEYNAI